MSFVLALGNQMFFFPRSTKFLSFTMPYLLEDASPENLPYGHYFLLYEPYSVAYQDKA